MKIGAIIQARTSSTRLPEKVLKNLPYGSNITVLEQVIRRLKLSKMLNEIIVATTTRENDKKIVDIARKEKVVWFRGSENNVLERYYLAAEKNFLDIIVRITSDCPCIDPYIVDSIIKTHLKTNSDYTSNTIVRTTPEGLDVEVIGLNALRKSYNNVKSDLEKEHVTTYIHKNSHLFKMENVKAPNELYGPHLRITLDTEEDYTLLCAIFDYLYYKDEFFTTESIIKLFEKKPWLKLINKKIVEKKFFETFEEEFEEALKLLKLQELGKISGFLEECHNSLDR